MISNKGVNDKPQVLHVGVSLPHWSGVEPLRSKGYGGRLVGDLRLVA